MPIDKNFRLWLQTLPSCLDGQFSEYLEDGRKLCVAAHVRRAGNSGTAFKAPFSMIPMTQIQHLHQHNHGELACLRKFTRDAQLILALHHTVDAARLASDWFDNQANSYRRAWYTISGDKKVLEFIREPQLTVQQ